MPRIRTGRRRLAARCAMLLAGGLCAVLPGFAATHPPPVPASTGASPPPVAAPLPPNAERISHGRFRDLVVYRPAGSARSVALLLSGDAGWNQAAAGMAQSLAQNSGALVVGIDTPRFLAVLEKDGGDCAYTSGDLENLSHFVQAYYKLPTYLAPILTGYASGATFGYANLVQAPANTFGGAVMQGLCPRLDLHKPLCKGSGLESARSADGKGFDYLPAKSLSNPMTVVPDPEGKACPAGAGDFAARIGTTRLAGSASFQSAFEQLASSLKPTLPPPPASLEGLPVIEVPPKAGVAEAPVFAVLISGDGGWAGLDQEVAGALSAHGIPVVGVDSLRYFWTPRTPESTAADTDRIIRYYLSHWNKQQVLLVGYSQGADVMPFIINRLPPETRQHVALGAVMGLSEHALFEFHVGNWVNANQDQGLPTAPEMEKQKGMEGGSTTMLCIYGEGETDTLCPKLDPKKVDVVKLKGGHHFGGDYDRLAREILSAAKLPQQAAAAPPGGALPAEQTSAVAEDQSQAPDNKEESNMVSLHLLITPLLSLIAGILILVMPRLLNYIVAIYLIAVGAVGLLQHYH